MEDIIAKTEEYVKEYMSHHDASHDYQHVQRVLALAQQIELAENILNHNIHHYDSGLIILSSLLHDVGDKKYSNSSDLNTIANFLIASGASLELAEKVQTVAGHVSYSAEIRDPARVPQMIAQIPELAIVQDADRLDALGAVGIGRAFTFGGARGSKKDGMEEAIKHFEEKLERLGALMKTETGRKMAKERTRRVREFRAWWEGEMEDADCKKL